MNEFVSFFKEIFMFTEANEKIGLAQFKSSKNTEKTFKKEEKTVKEVKLSDLMRRSA